jgi:hypothetical protein
METRGCTRSARRTFGVADAVEISHSHPIGKTGKSIADYFQSPLLVVERSIARQESLAWGSDVSVAYVCEDVG